MNKRHNIKCEIINKQQSRTRQGAQQKQCVDKRDQYNDKYISTLAHKRLCTGRVGASATL